MIRTPRTLPTILEPAEVTALLSACRKWRDRAMVEAMVLGGLRRSEVLGLRFRDLKFGDRRVFVVDGKGGHQRLVPISKRFFDSVANYLDAERPERADPERASRRTSVTMPASGDGMPWGETSASSTGRKRNSRFCPAAFLCTGRSISSDGHGRNRC